MAQQFFYDGQIRRFITQFIRLVSGFQVEYGQSGDGTRALQQIPVIYGDPSRQAAQILKQNSENLMNSVPAMAVYVTGLDYDRDRMQEPTFISKIDIRQRQYDPVTGDYLSTPGDAYTVERLMPVPYKLTLKLDIWTSNTEQKLQILEQIVQQFNPALEIQNSDNYVDWGSLTYVELKSTVWDSRSVPAMTDESISIATMQFEMPIWISAPAKVKKLGVVTNIINNVYDPSTGSLSDALLTDADLMTRRSLAFRDYALLYVGNELKLVKNTRAGDAVNEDVLTFDGWGQLASAYGKVRNGITQIRLRHPNGISEIVGTIASHPTDDTVMLYDPDIDTLPQNSMSPVDAIIDPYAISVDQLNLLTPDIGTRYLITNPIGSYNNYESAIAWDENNPTFVANAGDIVEYTGDGWMVKFDSINATDYQFVLNLNTMVQYKYDYIANEWSKAVEGVYTPENWSLVI